MAPTQSGPDETSHACRSGGGWQFPLLLAILLVGLVTVAKSRPYQQVHRRPGPAAPWIPSPQPTGETVRLSIDFGNGARKEFAALPWQQGMTVADLLNAARQFQPGLEFAQIGKGESGLLSSLDGLANQGAAGRNWIYQVDGQYAHVSFCQEKLEPGMHVLWKFTDELYNDQTR